MDINVAELKQRLDAGDKFIFLDVREPHEYQEFNLGAELIPLGTLSAHIERLADHKEEEIIIHCRSGARSGQAQMLLQSMGFTHVRNVQGGILDWIQNFGR